MTAPQDWFHNAIVDGVQLLYSLALTGTPAAEVLPLTTTGWVETLWRGGVWDEQLDARRIADGFFALAGSADRWPAPRQLLDKLPARPEVHALAPPVPVLTPQRIAELRAMRCRVTDALTSIPRLSGVRPYSYPTGGCAALPDPGDRQAQQAPAGQSAHQGSSET